MKPYREIQPEQLILRDRLARDRTELANERTLLAYIRTGIMLLGSSITLIKLLADSPFMLILGYVLFPISLLTIIWGIIRYRKVKAILDKVEKYSRNPNPVK